MLVLSEGGKPGDGRKTLQARTRSVNKLSPHVTPDPGIEPLTAMVRGKRSHHCTCPAFNTSYCTNMGVQHVFCETIYCQLFLMAARDLKLLSIRNITAFPTKCLYQIGYCGSGAPTLSVHLKRSCWAVELKNPWRYFWDLKLKFSQSIESILFIF